MMTTTTTVHERPTLFIICPSRHNTIPKERQTLVAKPVHQSNKFVVARTPLVRPTWQSEGFSSSRASTQSVIKQGARSLRQDRPSDMHSCLHPFLAHVAVPRICPEPAVRPAGHRHGQFGNRGTTGRLVSRLGPDADAPPEDDLA